MAKQHPSETSMVQLFAVTESGPQQLPIGPGKTHVHDLFDDLPIGVYTSLCTFGHNKFLDLKGHLDRLEYSARRLGWSYQLDRQKLRHALHRVCSDYPLTNSRVRIDILAKPAWKLGTTSRLLIGLGPFEPPPATIYTGGVTVGITRKLGRHQPKIKRAEFVLRRRQCFEENPSVYECLLVDDRGRILEGTTSNFYGVRDRILWTAGRDVLEGIARKLVLQVAEEESIHIRYQAIRLDDLHTLDEAALSSSSRAIVPIVQIGDQPIGEGKPGPVVAKLLKAYNDHVITLIQPAVAENEE